MCLPLANHGCWKDGALWLVQPGLCVPMIAALPTSLGARCFPKQGAGQSSKSQLQNTPGFSPFTSSFFSILTLLAIWFYGFKYCLYGDDAQLYVLAWPSPWNSRLVHPAAEVSPPLGDRSKNKPSFPKSNYHVRGRAFPYSIQQETHKWLLDTRKYSETMCIS